jgi:hypothetical protein
MCLFSHECFHQPKDTADPMWYLTKRGNKGLRLLSAVGGKVSTTLVAPVRVTARFSMEDFLSSPDLGTQCGGDAGAESARVGENLSLGVV